MGIQDPDPGGKFFLQKVTNLLVFYRDKRLFVLPSTIAVRNMVSF
jgi:hypothetical protein